MTLESVVDAGVGVGVDVGVGAYWGIAVIRIGACNGSARVTCGVNDETET